MTIKGIGSWFRWMRTLPSYLGGRLDAIDAKIDGLRQETIERIADLEKRRKEQVVGLGQQVLGLDQSALTINRRLSAIDSQLSPVDQRLSAIDSQLSPVDQRLSAIEARLSLIDQECKELKNEVQGLNKRFIVQTPWKPEDLELRADPEFGLMALLYGYVSSGVALDVGANGGRLSADLLKIGYQVYAFEPFPESVERLSKSLGSNPRLHIFPFALGSEETTLQLHIASGATPHATDSSLYNTFRPHHFPEGLAFTQTIEVPVRTIAGLVERNELPAELGLVKIDTEGFDLEVIRGMRDLRPPIVVSEFWGSQFVFSRDRDPNATDTAAETISEMQRRGYWWSIVFYRLEGSDTVQFTTNSAEVPQKGWGNIFFFRDHEPFLQATRWCTLVLPGIL